MPLWNLLWRRKGRWRNRWKRVFVWGRGIEWCIRKKPKVRRGEIKEKQEEVEEKQDSCQKEVVALLNQLISLHTRDSPKAEHGNQSNLPVFLSVAFLFGFFACYLFLSNFHWAAPDDGRQTFVSRNPLWDKAKWENGGYTKWAKNTVKWESVFFLIINWW